MVPSRYTPSGARGASSFPSRCATANTTRWAAFSACSTALSEISRETKSGTTIAGNTTTSRTGNSGSTSGMSSSRSTASSAPAMGGLYRFGRPVQKPRASSGDRTTRQRGRLERKRRP